MKNYLETLKVMKMYTQKQAVDMATFSKNLQN